MPIDKKQVDQISHLEFLAKQVVEGFITGLHKSPFHGFSVEFAEHRLYNSGESTRHMDWKLFARTDKLFVKRYEEETNLRCQIVIDNSSSMYYPTDPPKDAYNKIGFSVHAAAALIELLKRQRDAVGLSVFDDKIEVHTPSKSSVTHVKMLYSELEKMLQQYKPGQNRSTVVTKSLHQIAESIHKRSLVAIFSDMFDPNADLNEMFSALQHLRHNKHEVILFHVTDKKHELEFKFENRPYTFIDMETGEQLKLTPLQVKEKYLEAVQNFKKELHLKCTQYRIDLVEADINEGFYNVLLQYLVKRSKLY
jgi:uncharacterized protein (DUF58 family)